MCVVFRSRSLVGWLCDRRFVYRNRLIRVLRDNVVIFEGVGISRRFKDDVGEVRNGVECGIGVKNYDVKVDQIEVFDVKEGASYNRSFACSHFFV